MCLDFVFGVMVLALWGFLPVSSQVKCESSQTIEIMQTTCKTENEAVVYAQDNKDNVEVCRHFPLLLKCSVTALPHCFDYLETTFAEYAHSPFSCHLTPEQIMELQVIHLKGTQVTEASSVLVKTPSSHPVSATGDEGMASTGYISSSVTEQVTSHPQTGSHKGNNEKHSGGNNGNGTGSVLLSRSSMMLLVLISAKSLWRLTS